MIDFLAQGSMKSASLWLVPLLEGKIQATDGNLYCIFRLKNDMFYTNESARGNGVEHSAKLPPVCRTDFTRFFISTGAEKVGDQQC